MTNFDTSKTTIMKHFRWPQHWQPQNSDLAEVWHLAQNMAFPSRKHDDWRWINFENLDLETLKPLEPNITEFGVEEDAIVVPLNTAKNSHAELLNQVHGKLINPETDTFSAINAAMAEDGRFIYVPANTRWAEPLTVRFGFDAKNSAAMSKTIIWLDRGAEAKIVLEFDSETYDEAQAFFNFQLEIRLDDGARLDLLELQRFGTHVAYVSREVAQINKNAHLNWTYVALGTRLSKNFITADLLESGSEVLMNGAYFCGSGQVINLDTQQNHIASNAHSNLLYKGAAVGNGKAIWEGMIYVDPLAQRTDSYQTNRNLILDEKAEIKTIPGLEINANDVSCSHGATVGRLNDDELFYLESRGIPLKEAEKMIVEGFFSEVLRNSGDEAMVEALVSQISDKFDTNHANA